METEHVTETVRKDRAHVDVDARGPGWLIWMWLLFAALVIAAVMLGWGRGRRIDAQERSDVTVAASESEWTENREVQERVRKEVARIETTGEVEMRENP